MSESFESAKFLLGNSCLAHLLDSTIIDDREQRIDLDALRKAALSSGEQIIVEAAAVLWNGYGLCSIGEAIRTLDDANYAAFVNALTLRRPAAFTTNLAS